MIEGFSATTAPVKYHTRGYGAMSESRLERIENKIDGLYSAINGNGKKGLKERIMALETKFWIILILLIPLFGCAVKAILS